MWWLVWGFVAVWLLALIVVKGDLEGLASRGHFTALTEGDPFEQPLDARVLHALRKFDPCDFGESDSEGVYRRAAEALAPKIEQGVEPGDLTAVIADALKGAGARRRPADRALRRLASFIEENL